MGVLEKHGDHLPIGQDMLYTHAVACLAAEKEPAVVFPPYPFGQIFEARHQPGTIALRSGLLLEVLESVCGEISRNGLPRIIIVNGHGGNSKMLAYFCQLMLERERDYQVYLSDVFAGSPQTSGLLTAKVDGHAGEAETSCMLSLRPDLVHPGEERPYGAPRGRLDTLKKVGLYSGLLWYSDHPGHFCSDGTPGTAAKGKVLVDAHVRQIVRQIKAVKKDRRTRVLSAQFQRRARKPVCLTH
jgi:creatinine amidohydrolase